MVQAKKKTQNPLSEIPQVEKIVNEKALQDTIAKIGKPAAVKITSDYIKTVRAKARNGEKNSYRCRMCCRRLQIMHSHSPQKNYARNKCDGNNFAH